MYKQSVSIFYLNKKNFNIINFLRCSILFYLLNKTNLNNINNHNINQTFLTVNDSLNRLSIVKNHKLNSIYQAFKISSVNVILLLLIFF